MSRFQYAPGLPGYGTQGADGSNGLLGISLYFSELDGETQTASIRSRIDNNELLTTASGTKLPGYPTRVYQNGDIFIDTNGKVYEIDLGLINKYVPTGERLNTSTIFVQGLDASTDPTFTRYHNAYTTEKFLLDNVFSVEGVSNYTQSPDEIDGIYGLPALNFGQIKYVDISLNNYLPYTIWNNTINTAEPEKAIALVKEYASETWRWGNVDNVGNVRDVSLILDFSNTYVSKDLEIFGDIKFNGVSENYIYSDGSIFLQTEDNDTNPGNVFIISGDALENGDYHGGDVFLLTGDGASHNETAATTSAGNSGSLKMFLGDAGDASSSFLGNAFGGNGGVFTLKSGMGGRAFSFAGDAFGGPGGDVSIMAGSGGYAEGSSTTEGGIGGNIYLEAGAGGIGVGDDGGDGGDVILISGKAGNGSTSGTAGDVRINGGANAGGTAQEGDVRIQEFGGVSYVGGDLRLTSGTLYVADGTITDPIIAFDNQLGDDIGFYRYGNDAIGVALGNSNGRQGIRFNNGADGAYIAPIDCSLVIQPVDLTTHSNGLGIEIVTRVAGSNGGALALRTNGGESGGDGGNILIQAGNGSGSGDGGDITLDLGTGGGSNGNLFLIDLLTTTTTTYRNLVINDATKAVFSAPTASDEKYKNIIGNLTGSLEGIKSISGYKFTWNEKSSELFDKLDKDEIHIGLIAQEVEKVFPLLVNDINDGEIEYKRIAYDKFPAIFVEAIKEQQTEIEDLKNIVNKQQQQIDKLLELNNLK